MKFYVIFDIQDDSYFDLEHEEWTLDFASTCLLPTEELALEIHDRWDMRVSQRIVDIDILSVVNGELKEWGTNIIKADFKNKLGVVK